MIPAIALALEDAGVAPHLIAPLAHYGALLLASTDNVTGAKDAASVVTHLVDSLTLTPYLREPFLDVGSGGGLPGLVLAIATGFRGTLLDANRKKAAFLQLAVRELGLASIDVCGDRAEAAARTELRARFATATARAVSSAPTVVELVVPFLMVGGVALLQRGVLDERERIATRDACLVLGAEVTDEIAVTGGRRILVVTKVTPTNDRFPRRNGIPEKRPLCYT